MRLGSRRALLVALLAGASVAAALAALDSSVGSPAAEKGDPQPRQVAAAPAPSEKQKAEADALIDKFVDIDIKPQDEQVTLEGLKRLGWVGNYRALDRFFVLWLRYNSVEAMQQDVGTTGSYARLHKEMLRAAKLCDALAGGVVPPEGGGWTMSKRKPWDKFKAREE